MTKIRSMTGFGRCEVTDGTRKISVEMKSVNHRYLDISIKIPKKLSFFETAIRGELKEYIQRGKVDVFITYEDTAESNLCVKYNRELAAEYMKYLWQMSEDFSLDNDVRVFPYARIRIFKNISVRIYSFREHNVNKSSQFDHRII